MSSSESTQAMSQLMAITGKLIVFCFFALGLLFLFYFEINLKLFVFGLFSPGADEEMARNLIEACNNNVELAVTMFFESNLPNGSQSNNRAGGSSSSSSNVVIFFFIGFSLRFGVSGFVTTSFEPFNR